ncbi:MAG: hypothetical protein AABX33_08690 [Nanoarchaeota archaeon]
MVNDSFTWPGLLRVLERWGLTEVVLPFMLVFIIVYAVLQKTKILGDEKKNLNIMMGIIVGMLVVIPHVMGNFPPNADPVVILNDALPQVSVVLVAVVFLLVMIGVFGQDYVLLGVTMPGWITFISFVIIVVIFGGAAGWWAGDFGATLENFFGTDGVAIVIMLLVFGITIAWITGESKDKEQASLMNRFGMDFSKLFGKK